MTSKHAEPPAPRDPSRAARTEEDRRDLAIDTMASWALEGMEPTRAIAKDINELVRGGITTEEMLKRVEAGAYDG